MAPNHTHSFHEKLTSRIEDVDSLLCVGLDPNPADLPSRFADASLPIASQLLNWNLAVIEACADYALAFKPNIAFYEALGIDGLAMLRRTLEAIPGGIPVILDAKRGDIGSTAAAYARACFEELRVDAVTLNAYLGRDSIDPFLAYPDKGLFVLCRTSNPGSSDFQELEISDWQTLDREANQPLYIHVARGAVSWSPNIGLVVGATFPESLASVRSVAPHAWFLVPGIGAQGGDVQATLNAGLRDDGLGLLVNVSRGISLADDPGDAARRYRDELNDARRSYAATSSRGKAGPDCAGRRRRPFRKACSLGRGPVRGIHPSQRHTVSHLYRPAPARQRTAASFGRRRQLRRYPRRSPRRSHRRRSLRCPAHWNCRLPRLRSAHDLSAQGSQELWTAARHRRRLDRGRVRSRLSRISSQVAAARARP